MERYSREVEEPRVSNKRIDWGVYGRPVLYLHARGMPVARICRFLGLGNNSVRAWLSKRNAIQNQERYFAQLERLAAAQLPNGTVVNFTEMEGSSFVGETVVS